jgi:predicted house-cleaning noncanonical NTP pyrophosphatase (MazG superfamily)
MLLTDWQDEEVEKIRAGIKIKLQDKQDEDLAKQLEALAHVTNLIDLSAASVQIVSWHDGQSNKKHVLLFC